MQAPFTAGRYQPITHQNLPNIQPAGPFPAWRQLDRPIPIQLQLLPYEQRHPANAPLPRSLESHLIHTNVNYIVIVGLHLSIFRKQLDLARFLCSMLQNFDGSPPCFTLAVVDLPKIEHMLLCNTTAADAVIFNDAPVAVFFAVFLPSSHS
jgi:hypothetical protein